MLVVKPRLLISSCIGAEIRVNGTKNKMRLDILKMMKLIYLLLSLKRLAKGKKAS